MDDKQRYEIFKIRQGKCQYCGTRLVWDAYEVKGLSGGWKIDETDTNAPKAYCFKCYEFPNKGKTPHNLTVQEVERTTAQALGTKDNESQEESDE